MAEAGEVRTDEELDAEGQARRRLALAQIRQYPDPALRMRARDVADFDGDLSRLVARMTDLMHDAHGVGLAATQVGVLRRVFVFHTEDREPTAVVNPRVVEQSGEVESSAEGCLSLQGVTVPVERSVRMTVAGNDPTGADISLDLEGLAARVAQHELDHLEGTLIIDRTTPEARREALAVLRPQPVLAAVP